MSKFYLFVIFISFLRSTKALTELAEYSKAVFEFVPTDKPVGPGIQLQDQTVSIKVYEHGIVRRSASDSGDSNLFEDNHIYYNKIVAINHPLAAFYSAEFDRIFSKHPTKSNINLNNGKNLALTVPLTFPFDFYGHPVRTIELTTSGFIYVNQLTHPYLTFSQFIAPLMADFETNSAISSIKFVEIENAFWVRWENLLVSRNYSLGNFSFQCALFANGSIVFDYISIPISMDTLRSASSILKVGLSDAFYYDVRAPEMGLLLRKIVKYHELSVPLDQVVTDGVIHLIHLPTCNQQTSCSNCTDKTRVPAFNCSWCKELNRCSSGVDRRLQEWHDSDCHYTFTKLCWKDAPKEGGVLSASDFPTSHSTTSAPTTTFANGKADEKTGAEKLRLVAGDRDCVDGSACDDSDEKPDSDPNEAGRRIVLGVCLGLLAVGAAACIAGVLTYGYRHPGSRIGAWLIEHRPSRFRQRFFNSGSGADAASGGVGVGGESRGESYKVSSENAYVNFSNA